VVAAPKGGLGLSDENGEVRAVLNVAEYGAWLGLYDEQGKAIWLAP